MGASYSLVTADSRAQYAKLVTASPLLGTLSEHTGTAS